MAEHLHLEGLTKTYDRRTVVDAIDLAFEAGRFTTLLGPSGCGKTTTLRMIAGLERPDGGTVRLGNRRLSGDGLFVEPDKRGMGMVFQSYAVWPHMTVAENVGFPLKLRGVPARERQARVAEVLETVGLGQYHASAATNLSGGQQQRVAIARALVYRPEVLLLDEPLSNLDAKLREQMRIDLRQLQRRFGITTIMVTHDQDEAMVVSDRIVVMSEGRIEQVGTPEAVYFNPDTAFVMGFLGALNRVPATVAADGRLLLAGSDGITVSVPPEAACPAEAGRPVALCLRQEDLSLVAADDRRPGDWAGRIELATFLGRRVEYIVRLGAARLRVEASPFPRLAEGDEVFIRAALGSARVWPLPEDTAPTAAAFAAAQA